MRFSDPNEGIFDHYLMDKPEPAWMRDGVPEVKKGEAIE